VTLAGWIGWVTTIFGSGVVALGLGVGLHHRRRERSGRQVPGRIVDVAVESSGDGRMRYPVFEFLAADGPAGAEALERRERTADPRGR
jgi:hypothetical protein